VQEAIQVGGALLVLAAFVLAQANRLATNSRVYLALNLVGGGVFPDLVKSLANQGRLAIIGYVDDKHHAEIDLETVHGKRLQIFGVSNTRMTAPQRAEAMKNFARDILPGFADGKITAVIDKVFPFDQLPQAKAYVETNAQLGKVVVKMP